VDGRLGGEGKRIEAARSDMGSSRGGYRQWDRPLKNLRLLSNLTGNARAGVGKKKRARMAREKYRHPTE